MSDDHPETRSADGDRADPLGLDAITEEILPALIARLRGSHLGELEVGGDGWRVRVRRAPASAARVLDERMSTGAGTDRGDGAPSGEATSPGVGYFLPADGLRIGASVQAGDVLGSVDVLGIVQDVAAPVDGIVSRILAEVGQAVEYGQPLIDIDPLDGDLGGSPADGGGTDD